MNICFGCDFNICFLYVSWTRFLPQNASQSSEIQTFWLGIPLQELHLKLTKKTMSDFRVDRTVAESNISVNTEDTYYLMGIH